MIAMVQKYLAKPTIPVIHLNGPIVQTSGKKIQAAIEKINPHTARAIAVVVNSPGGLPVQSHIICQKIKLFANQHHLPIYTFAQDVAASGGYFVLCIGDRVYVDQSSLVGSIGVIGSWIGLSKWLKFYEIENRKITSNEKSISYNLDPFDEFNQQANLQIMEMLQKTHKSFIQHVENYRKMKIQTIHTEKIYSAQVFNGSEAIQLGLADHIGNYQTELLKLHPGCNLVEICVKSNYEKIYEAFQKTQSFNLEDQFHLQNIINQLDQKNL